MLRHNRTAMFGLIGFISLALITILAPVLAPHDPIEMDYDHLKEAPTRAHPFGTDDLGRDVLSRVLYGGRESLRVGIMSIIISWTGGIVVGLAAGYYGGLIDTSISRLIDVFLAFPTILLLLSIVAALGPGLKTVLIALGLANIPWNARFVRGAVLSARNYEYVTAARVIGGNSRYIMFTQILPNIMPPLIVYATVGMGQAILITAGLSYVGLGAQPPSPEWGAMLNAARTFIRHSWWMSFFPGMAIFIVVLCVNLLGDGLRDALDPKLRV